MGLVAGQGRERGARLVLSAATRGRVEGQLRLRGLASIELPGQNRAMELYSVLGRAGEDA